MKSFRADYVFPVCADPIKNGIVTVDNAGRVISVSNQILPGNEDIPIEELKGAICPGFINTHCHIELSHLKDKIPARGGLVSFIKSILQFRNADAKEIEVAAAKADIEMYENGIVAVGDISNTNATIAIKANSKLYYHTFVEIFGFIPEKAEENFNNALAILNEFKPQSCSITPHAPYSVSKELFRLIKNILIPGRT